MARPEKASIFQRFEACRSSSSSRCCLLFMYRAPEVFLRPSIYTTFLSTLPPLILLATGLTFVIGAGEIDLSFPSVIAFSGFVLRCCSRRQAGSCPTGLRGGSLASPLAAELIRWGGVVSRCVGSFRRLPQRPAHRQDRHSVVHGDARHAVLLGRHGDRAVRRQVLCAARRRESSRVADGSSGVRCPASTVAWLQQLSIQALWTALIVVFLWFILNRHRFGEHILFIGDSNDVSRVVGIDVDREKIKLFTLMGLLAACAAIILTLENKNFFGNQGQGYLLDRHRLRADRRHLDLRRPGDHRRHGVRLLHHRHGRGRASSPPASRARGCSTVQGLIFLVLDHLLSLRRTNRSGGARCSRTSAVARQIRPDTNG